MKNGMMSFAYVEFTVCFLMWPSRRRLHYALHPICVSVCLSIWLSVPCIGVTSYWALGMCPPPSELVLVHQSDTFCLHISPVGSGRLLVNTKHFAAPATDSQSLKLAQSQFIVFM